MAGVSQDHRDIEAQMERQRNGESVKHDLGKPRLDLLPLFALEGLADVLEFGARKYEAWNFMGGMDHERVFAACLRHLAAYQAGENLDRESGLSHIDHAIANLVFLTYYIKSGKGGDFRHGTGKT